MDINKVINDVFKIILNILLIVIAIGAIITGISKEMDASSIGWHFAIATACVATVLMKKYRYILASIALLLIIISYFLWV